MTHGAPSHYAVPLPVAAWFWFDLEIIAMVNEKNRQHAKVNPWNDKRMARLITLEHEGFSPSEMVPMFGGQLTRAQIVAQLVTFGMKLHPERRFRRVERPAMEARL